MLIPNGCERRIVFGKVLSYEKISDCPETGDSRVRLIVQLDEECTLPDHLEAALRVSAIVVYVSEMKQPGYIFHIDRHHKGLEIPAQWFIEPDLTMSELQIELFGNQESCDHFRSVTES